MTELMLAVGAMRFIEARQDFKRARAESPAQVILLDHATRRTKLNEDAARYLRHDEVEQCSSP